MSESSRFQTTVKHLLFVKIISDSGKGTKEIERERVKKKERLAGLGYDSFKCTYFPMSSVGGDTDWTLFCAKNATFHFRKQRLEAWYISRTKWSPLGSRVFPCRWLNPYDFGRKILFKLVLLPFFYCYGSVALWRASDRVLWSYISRRRGAYCLLVFVSLDVWVLLFLVEMTHSSVLRSLTHLETRKGDILIG